MDGHWIFLGILSLLAPCYSTKDASNNDIMYLIKHVLRDVSQLADHVRKQDARIEKLIGQQALLTKQIQGLKIGDDDDDDDKVLKKLKTLAVKVDGVHGILTAVLPGKIRRTAAPSCQWLDEHYYNLRNGIYWVLNEEHPEADPKQTYCHFRKKKASTTKSPTTTTPTTTPPPTPATPGTKKNPGASCKALKENNKHLKSGMYWISLGNSTEVFCDMETGRGGWTMVGHAVVEKESESKEVEYRKILSDDLTKLGEVTQKRFLLGAYGLYSLYNFTSFEQIRFFCHKPWHGRTVHIRTKNNTIGKDVVDFMLERSITKPVSCDSYERFADDDSALGKNCAMWHQKHWYGVGARGKGGSMYDTPMVIDWQHYFSLFPGRIECDDYVKNDKAIFSSIGKWAFYVR